MADPISNFFSYLGTISVPKAQNLLTDKTISGMANTASGVSNLKQIASLTGTTITIPPKATTADQIAGYLQTGANFLQSIGGIVSAVKPAQAQVTAPSESIKITSQPAGTAATGQQLYPGQTTVVIPPSGSTAGSQGSQAAAPAIDMTWIIWLIIALLVIAGIYVITKGK